MRASCSIYLDSIHQRGAHKGSIQIIKNYAIASSAFLFLITAYPLHADELLESRVSNLELEMQMVRTETSLGNFGARTASGNPQIDSYGWYTKADFLWWGLYEGGTDFVYTKHEPLNTLPLKGSLKSLSFDWNPGFRVGAGYQLDEHDGWDGFINFTWYQTQAARHASAPDGRFLLTSQGMVTDPELDKSKAVWNVDFYDLYLELGRNYFVSRYLSLRPSFGLMTSWFYQNRRIHYHDAVSDAKFRIHGHNNFWGIGPRGQIQANWYFDSHFSLYGSAIGGLLWGTFDVEEEELFSSFGEVYDMDFDTHHFCPMLGFQLGLAYDINFNDNLNHFGIKLLYENQYWWRQNQFPKFSGQPSFYWEHQSEDLSMQGLTANFRFDF